MRPRGFQGFGRWVVRGIWHTLGPGQVAVGPLCCYRCCLQARAVRSLVWLDGALVFRRRECTKQTKTFSTKHCVALSRTGLCARGASGVLDPSFCLEGYGEGMRGIWPGIVFSTLLLPLLGLRDLSSGWLGPSFSECRSAPNEQKHLPRNIVWCYWRRL